MEFFGKNSYFLYFINMEKHKSFPVEISALAQDNIRKIIQVKNIEANYGLRLGVKSMGCHSQEYFIGFDTIKNDDEVYDYGGFKVLIRKRDFMYLIGTQLAFETDEKGNQGFAFGKKER